MRNVHLMGGLVVGLLLLTSPLLAGPPAVGDVVWAQWKPNQWYHGKIARTCPLGVHIAFDDGDEICAPPSLVALDKAPAEAGSLKVGTRVLARWTDGRPYPATVAAAGKDKIDVQFDDGATGKVAIADLRLLATSAPARKAAVGDVVWAQWKPNAYYHGKVDKTCDRGLHVAFDDGDEGCYPPILVVVDKPAEKGSVKVGTRVLARWKDGKPYPAVVTSADDASVLVRFDDGASGSSPIADLRPITK